MGVGGGITGQGGDLIVIDDPSLARRPTVKRTVTGYGDWFTELYTCQEPGAAIVLILTRWHMDDLAGRVLASDEAPE